MKTFDPIKLAMEKGGIVILFTILLVIGGIYGLINIPKQEFPTFTIRQGLVIGIYPGATAEQIENEVTKPLENFIFQFKEINKSATISMSRNGIVYIITELNDGVTEKDQFWSKFKQRLQEYKSMNLPSGVITSVQDDFGDTSALLITIESEQKTFKELEDYADDLEDRLRSIEAVSDLKLYGLQKEQITIYVDKEKIANYGLNTTLLTTQLFTRGFTTLSGTLRNDNYEAPIFISESYNSIKDIEEQIVYSDVKGNIIRLKDIARVVREYPPMTTFISNNGIKCILLSLQMRQGNNIVHMGKQVDEVMKDFEESLPDDVKIFRITDQSKVVNDSVKEFLKELLIAILSVILVVLLLLPLRVASISAMTIPITIFISIALFYFIGLELNSVTLATLLVTLGMVVDDSIVVIDGYLDRIDHGVGRWEASMDSAKSLFMSVLSATLAISVTFFPFLFTMKGVLSDFVKAFPWSISIVLFTSLLVALLLIPHLQYVLIRKGISDGNNKKSSIFNFMQRKYRSWLTLCFKYPILTIVTGIVISVAGGFWLLSSPVRILSSADRDQFAVEIYLPNGSPVEKTKAVADELYNLLKDDERIVSITSFIGQSSPRFHTSYAPKFPGSNFAQFIVNTKNAKTTVELLDDYTEKYCDYFPEAMVLFRQIEYTAADSPIEIRLSSNDKTAIRKYAQIIADTLKKTDNLLLVRTDIQDFVPGVYVEVDDDKMFRLGINKTSLSLNTAMQFGSGIPITSVPDGDILVPVKIRYEQSVQPDFSDIPNALVVGYGGATEAPLRQFATVQPTWQQGQIVHRNGIPTITVSAAVARNHNYLEVTKEVEKIVDDINIPQDIKVEYGGEKSSTQFYAPQILIGLVFAVLIIFLILLFHFGNIKLSLLILCSMVFCIPGAAFGIHVMNAELSMTATLGIVSLMGILVRNGIIMIDYAEELRKSGEDVRQAAFDAAMRRMRPIFLTSAAASMGVVPMILGKSTLWGPMGTVVFFGTWFMILFVVTVLPVTYWKLFAKTPRA